MFFEPVDSTFVWFLAYCTGCTRGVLPMLRSIYSYLQTVTLFSRTPGAKPTIQPCQPWYIDSSFSSFTFTWRTSISASLSAKFRQALRNNIQMYVYRCTLYTTLQNPGWKRKAAYSQSAISAHFLRACGHYLCMLTGGWKQGVARDAQKRGVAPPSRYMCEYIHLVRGCCPGSAREVLPLVAQTQNNQKSFTGSAAVRSTSIIKFNWYLLKPYTFE